jgi:DNA-binding NarL/FixJ family response regulator/DNA-binding winged helix-turn-helix (wHTH) protein
LFHDLDTVNWEEQQGGRMKAQPDVGNAPGAAKQWLVTLLVAGHEDELDSDMLHRISGGCRRVIVVRSASLLDVLQRIQTERADIVLLSRNFREEETAVFVSNMRNTGFEGLILRIVDAAASYPDAQPSSSAAFRNSSIRFMRARRGRASKPTPSLTERQLAVVMRVSEGWTNVQMAQNLECTEAAIKATLQQIFKKLGVRKRSQVVRLALEQKLLPDAGKVADRSGWTTNRVLRVLLPSSQKGKQGHHVGDFVIDVTMHRVWVRGVETHLTPSEFELLEVFAAHQGELVRSTSLCEMFWQNPTAKQDSLRVLVRGLRAKIEMGKIPQYIVTERNFGYRFNPSSVRVRASRTFV